MKLIVIMLMCYVLKMFSVYFVILLGGEYMNMRNEFESLLAECGVERIVPIKKLDVDYLDENLIPENRCVNMTADDTDVNRMKRNIDRQK